MSRSGQPDDPDILKISRPIPPTLDMTDEGVLAKKIVDLRTALRPDIDTASLNPNALKAEIDTLAGKLRKADPEIVKALETAFDRIGSLDIINDELQQRAATASHMPLGDDFTRARDQKDLNAYGISPRGRGGRDPSGGSPRRGG